MVRGDFNNLSPDELAATEDRFRRRQATGSVRRVGAPQRHQRRQRLKLRLAFWFAVLFVVVACCLATHLAVTRAGMPGQVTDVASAPRSSPDLGAAAGPLFYLVHGSLRGPCWRPSRASRRGVPHLRRPNGVPSCTAGCRSK